MYRTRTSGRRCGERCMVMQPILRVQKNKCLAIDAH